MKILVINGSPKGDKSNTYKLTKAFLAGIQEGAEEKSNAKGVPEAKMVLEGKAGQRPKEALEIEEIQVTRLDIHPCLGCFSCWDKTPGSCCMQDDMGEVIRKLLWADVTIWSFPLYYYTVPGGLKNLIDRQLPMVLPFMVENKDGTGSGSHPARYDMSGKKTVLISTCGFYAAEGNYDGIYSLFDHICGKNQYTSIFCGQGELFRVPELSRRTDQYLEYVRRAGKEYLMGGIRPETEAELNRLLYPRETFEAMADASWGISRENGEKESDALVFTRQMAALYRPESYPGRELVLEMQYTDLGECYQIVLGKEGSRVITDGFMAATTRIETPITVWRSIAAGEIRGDEALMKQLYRVKGDFDLMLKWDTFFGGPGSSAEGNSNAAGGGDRPGTGGGIHIPRKATDMKILLFPWMAFWIFPAIHNKTGCLVSIAVCALVPLFFYQNKKTFYDVLSGVLVSGFSMAVLLGLSDRIVLPLSYLTFGIMWTVTCLGKIPLTAHYSMNDYNEEDALKNPLFMKTNRILTLAWGILYLLTPVWTYLLMGTGLKPYTGAINSIMPIFMGIFTVWFQKWYPRKVAGGN